MVFTHSNRQGKVNRNPITEYAALHVTRTIALPQLLVMKRSQSDCADTATMHTSALGGVFFVTPAQCVQYVGGLFFRAHDRLLFDEDRQHLRISAVPSG